MPTAMTFNNKAITFGSTPAWLSISSVDPYNPLGLPPFTIRCQFSSGYVPAVGDSRTLVDAGENIWDIYKSSDEWTGLLSGRAELLAVVGANTTGVTDMGNMFKNCTSLTSIPLFDTGSVTNTGGMFLGCTSLTTVPLFDTSSVINMDSMFYGCTSLTSVPLFDTGSVEGMGSMFMGCTILTTVPLFDTSSVRAMQQMFRNCTSLTSVPLFDTSRVTAMKQMFRSCTSLTSIPLFDTGSATSMDYMFYSCLNVESGALALYQQASQQTTPPTSYSYCFTNCGSNTVTGAAELAQISTDWGGTNYEEELG